jgi:hypothetical protein
MRLSVRCFKLNRSLFLLPTYSSSKIVGVGSMIPTNITREEVLKAILRMNKDGVPAGRKARKFVLVHEGENYPPKYVLSLANVYANGRELDPEEYSGGFESNNYLTRLGFDIMEKSTSERIKLKSSIMKRRRKATKRTHDERCPECKNTVLELLKSSFREVQTGYRFEAGIKPEDYEGTAFYPSLRKIYEALQAYRGHQEFTKAKSLPNVDYFVPDPGFILEFDESQHFTEPRRITLEHYPEGLKLGFDKNRWMTKCEEINAKDNDPPYRDEQRAWYDTLRDFLPSVIGLEPTVRLFSKGLRWCNLDPSVRSDADRFKELLKGKRPKPRVEVRADPDPSLARIVIAGEWDGEIEASRRLLKEVHRNWPKGVRVNCMITCGAFLTFPWPDSLSHVRDNKFPEESVLKILTSAAQEQCEQLLDEEIREVLLDHTDYVTIGIDTRKHKVSLSSVSIPNAHAELVTLVDLKKNKYYWTGKSFPTTGQERGLVRFPDLETHFVDLPFGKVMVLGCHDLSAFNLRGKANTVVEWRQKAREEFFDSVRTEKPDIVLHHPHVTDSIRTWTASWNELVRTAPSVKLYLGAGRYYNENGERSSLEQVLMKTKLGETIDIEARTV